jgi:hypothetical protein
MPKPPNPKPPLQAGVATLLFDLLTENESSNRRNVFDIPLLAGRLEGALGWLRAEGASLGLDPALPVGFFGASTGEGFLPIAGFAEIGGMSICRSGGCARRAEC